MRRMLPFYKARDTPLHRMHPVAKLALALSMVVATLVLSHPAYLMALLGGSIVLAFSARVHREWWRFMRLFILIAATVVIINTIASSRGETTFWEGPYVWGFGQLSVSKEGIAFGLMMALRLFIVVSAFTVISLTLHPDEFTQVLARIAYRSGLAVSLATRFYPAVVRDASAIVDAQRSRGLDLDSGGRISRIRRRIPVVLPLFHSSLERAVGTAEAMEARGFGTGTRSRWRKRGWGLPDVSTLVVSALLVVSTTVLYLFFEGAPEFYPTIDITLEPLTLVIALLLALLVSAPGMGRAHGLAGGGPPGR